MKEKLKSIIKSLPGFNFFNYFRLKKLFKQEFINDYKFYKRNYTYSQKDEKRIGYQMILLIHSLEKGMSSENLRPFGVEKIKKLINLITEYEKISDEKDYSYNLAINCLDSYCEIYKENNWEERNEYLLVKDFLSSRPTLKKIKVGSYVLNKVDFIIDSKIDYDKFISSRHSVRNFSNEKIREKDVEKAVKIAIKSPSACNRQMCKVYYIENKESIKYIESIAQGLGGFDLTNANYFIITFDIAANYFIGERNQGWFNAGLFSMNFSNALHSLGIGSCFMQFGNSFKEEIILKKQLNIPDSERIAVVIVAGYYDEVSRIPYSTRKDLSDIYFVK